MYSQFDFKHEIGNPFCIKNCSFPLEHLGINDSAFYPLLQRVPGEIFIIVGAHEKCKC